MEKLGKAGMLAALILISAGVVQGDVLYSLNVITNNGAYAGSSSIDLYFNAAANVSGVDFTFHNDSTVNSSIANIYFDDIGFLSYSGITNGAGTAFSAGGSPGNLPAGYTLTPSFAADFSFGASSPAPKNGINPGEWVKVSFNYKGSTTGADVINALNHDNLRVGVHLTALPDGSSESAAQTPEPATLLLLGIGTMVLIGNKKREN